MLKNGRKTENREKGLVEDEKETGGGFSSPTEALFRSKPAQIRSKNAPLHAPGSLSQKTMTHLHLHQF